MKKSQRRAAVVAVVAVATGALVLGMPAAYAVAPKTRPAVLNPMTASAAPLLASPVGVTHTLTVAPYSTITCTLTASTPLRYYGGAYPGGGVEAIAQVQCSQSVSTIAVQVALVKNSAVVSTSPVRYSYSTNLGGQTTDTPHGPGTYLTAAVAGVTFQDGAYWASPEADSASIYISS
jgi:hypothetical protein